MTKKYSPRFDSFDQFNSYWKDAAEDSPLADALRFLCGRLEGVSVAMGLHWDAKPDKDNIGD